MATQQELLWEAESVLCFYAFRTCLSLTLGRSVSFDDELLLCTPNFMVGASDYDKLMMGSSDIMVIWYPWLDV